MVSENVFMTPAEAQGRVLLLQGLCNCADPRVADASASASGSCRISLFHNVFNA